jgi:hypothetical protein
MPLTIMQELCLIRVRIEGFEGGKFEAKFAKNGVS